MNFDVVVLGGGHAGVEAAWAANQYGLRVAILTIPGVGLASAPCNPAVGGVGKGQVVRELDALGGLMGRLADLAGIQYRVLNESKGFAVQSTRVQVDKEKYSAWAEEIISKSSIEVIRERVMKVSSVDEGFLLRTEAQNEIRARKLVVTTGTFLGGRLHTGEVQTDGGRVGVVNSNGLGDLFSNVKTLDIRFKTGTPPRLRSSSLDYTQFVPQESDPSAFNFHHAHNPSERKEKQVCCYLTHTNEETLSIIRENRERSPIFNGQIKGIGPRYCPSIEDKAFRYPDRHKHHVFIEPEGLDLETIYPNGVSTSLPKEVQEEFLRKIPGLENCEIVIPGYAVEYDVVNTTELSRTLEYKDMPGLFFAGQVNGTSGYEEAAGQGLIAGHNAALSLVSPDKKLILSRDDSYIGVMIEDLVTNLRDEPYRLFTARSENRLYIREDNTVERIAPYRLALNLQESVDRYLISYLDLENRLEEIVKQTVFSAKYDKSIFSELNLGEIKDNTVLSEVLRRSQLNPVEALTSILSKYGLSFPETVIRNVAINTKYEGYIQRAQEGNERILKLGKRKIDWQKLSALPQISNECRQRIQKIRPETFSDLRLIEGIRPATLAFVAGSLS